MECKEDIECLMFNWNCCLLPRLKTPNILSASTRPTICAVVVAVQVTMASLFYNELIGGVGGSPLALQERLEKGVRG